MKAVNIEDGTTLYFPSGADFARYLGVSRQLVSQALKKWRTNKAVRGWTVSRVGFTEILQGEIVLVENKMLGLSCH